MPSFNGTVVSFDLEGGRKRGNGLRRISRGMGAGKECGKTERWDLTKLVYKLKLTTKACRNLYISEK